MTDNPYRDALRRVLKATPVDGSMVDPAAVHDAIGYEIIVELMAAQRWIVGTSTGAGEAPGEGAPQHPALFRRPEAVEIPGVQSWTNVGELVGEIPAPGSDEKVYQAPKSGPLNTEGMRLHLDVFDEHVRELVDLQLEAARRAEDDSIREAIKAGMVEAPVVQHVTIAPGSLSDEDWDVALDWFEEHRREIMSQRETLRELRPNVAQLRILVPMGSAPKGVVGGRAFGMEIFESPVVNEPMVVPAP